MKEIIKKYFDEVLLHKQYVLESGKILSKYLIENGDYDKSVELVNRCTIHDNSKFSKEAMELLISIKDKDDFMNPNSLLDEEKIRAIELHWKNNSHHPEYHNDICDMTELDLMEMACDCFARSLEYGTDFLEFILIRQNNRFKFPEEIFNKYYMYCEILFNESKKDENKIMKKKTI